MAIYLDNAATTQLDPRVLEAMLPYLSDSYGNPSSTHSHGRAARNAVETARKTVAEILNVSAGEIYFTSGGTEADNTFMRGAVSESGVDHIITSKIEHPAILQTAEYLESAFGTKISYVNLDSKGGIDYLNLAELASKDHNTLITLMHANNEIGNLLDLQRVSGIAAHENVLFHTDAVQTIGHMPIDLSNGEIHGLSASAHKFHGPKGHGFMFVKKGIKIEQFIKGGSQERSMRGGTESVHGIVGTAEALRIANESIEENYQHLTELKSRMISLLIEAIPGVQFNGYSADIDQSNSKVLSVSLPPSEKNDLLLFTLDLNGISASGGSACASGSTVGSHVLTELGVDPARQAIRFSFCKNNTLAEIEQTVGKLKEILDV